MTWPEYLDLIAALLAQAPWRWVAVGAIAGLILSAALIIIASLIVSGSDLRRRDSYYEDHVDGNHRV